MDRRIGGQVRERRCFEEKDGFGVWECFEEQTREKGNVLFTLRVAHQE
jgi:hypothetical protein